MQLAQFVERALGEEQAGFRPARSIIDQLFTMRQILESIDNQIVFTNFIDCKQAFESIWNVETDTECRNARATEQTSRRDILKVIECHKCR